MRQLALALVWAPAMTLARYVPGRNGELVHHLQALASGSGRERTLYVWGMPGSGRTHLAHALLAAVQAHGAPTAYVACAPDTVLTTALAERRAVALDDVHRLGEAGQVALFHLFNALKEANAIMIATGDAPPARLTLRPDVVTRLGWGLVYQVHPLTDAEKAEALARHAAARGFDLPQDVADYLLTHVTRDMGTLLAALDELDRFALEAKRAVTVPLARAALAAFARAAAPDAREAGRDP